TAEETARLERLVLDDQAALRLYVEYLHQHACLQWSAADPAFLAERPTPGRDSRRNLVARPPGPGPHPRVRRWLRSAAWLGAAAALLLAARLVLGRRGAAPPATVATLAGAKACKWDGGSVPTEIGARLPAGRLRLAEGLARIAFACGAEVTIEGPAE